MNLNKIAPCILLLFISLATQAQKTTDSLLSVDSLTYNVEDVIISATRNERLVNSLPVSSVVVTAEDIQNRQITNLSDLLVEIPGITTVPDFGGGEGTQLQGIDSEYVLILIDGAPVVGRSAGTFDVNRIALQQVEKVEIVKGASSSLYGNEALGGVVNIITKSPQYQTIQLSSKYASNNSLDAFASLQDVFSFGGYSLNARHFQTDGFRFADSANAQVAPYNNQEVNGKVEIDLSRNAMATIRGRYFHEHANDEFADDNLLTDEWNTQLKVEQDWNEHLNTTLDVAVTNYQTKYDREAIYYNEWLLQPELRMGWKDFFLAGLGLKNEQLDRSYFTSQPKLQSQYAYAQFDEHFLNDKLNVVLGARFDRHEQYESRISPKLALRYKLNRELALRASLGNGFKRPDFRQLYFNFPNPAASYEVIGTQEIEQAITRYKDQGFDVIERTDLSNFSNSLQPEYSTNLTIGTQYTKGVHTLEVNAFAHQLEQLIDTFTAAEIRDNATRIFSYRNISKANLQGLDVTVQSKLPHQISLQAGYQYLKSEDEDAKERFLEDPYVHNENNQSIRVTEDDYFGMVNRSKHMANITITKQLPELKSNTNIRTSYRSKYGLFDSNGNEAIDNYDEFVDGYAIVDWAWNYKIKDNYRLGVGMDNILNYKDEENIPSIPGRIVSANLFIQF